MPSKGLKCTFTFLARWAILAITVTIGTFDDYFLRNNISLGGSVRLLAIGHSLPDSFESHTKHRFLPFFSGEIAQWLERAAKSPEACALSGDERAVKSLIKRQEQR